MPDGALVHRKRRGDGGRILEEGEPAQIFTEPREARTREFLSRVLAGGRMQ